MPFVKGHGTENDFVLLPDPDGTLEVTPGAGAGAVRPARRARRRRRHPGGAGGCPAVPPASSWTTATPTVRWPRCAATGPGCSPGTWSTPAGRRPGTVVFETRGGIRTADVPAAGDVTIEMGPARLGGRSSTTVAGREIAGVAVDVGNPHLVCLTDLELADARPVHAAGLRLRRSFPDGVNIEFVTVLGPDRVAMRVHERGCGRDPVLRHRHRRGGRRLPGLDRALDRARSAVGVPGGAVSVTITDDDSTLTGPAVVVAAGTIDRDFWDRHR